MRMYMSVHAFRSERGHEYGHERTQAHVRMHVHLHTYEFGHRRERANANMTCVTAIRHTPIHICQTTHPHLISSPEKATSAPHGT